MNSPQEGNNNFFIKGTLTPEQRDAWMQETGAEIYCGLSGINCYITRDRSQLRIIVTPEPPVITVHLTLETFTVQLQQITEEMRSQITNLLNNIFNARDLSATMKEQIQQSNMIGLMVEQLLRSHEQPPAPPPPPPPKGKTKSTTKKRKSD